MASQDELWPDNAAGALRQALAQRVDDLCGYPVADLIDAWPDAAGRANAVLAHALAQWIERLDEDLKMIPADASLALADIKGRMSRTRSAMAQLLELVVGPPVPERSQRPGLVPHQLSARARAIDPGGVQLH